MLRQTPLRYPGGKARLGPFFSDLIRANGLHDKAYVEPYAGGAGVAMYLLLGEFVNSVHINDLDESVHAFWRAVLDHTDKFCALLESASLTPREWYRQKAILAAGLRSSDTLRLGFATFYLNRTNRSGIMNGGMIGGKKQSGKWKLDARFNRAELIQRIRKISRYRQRIHLFNEDALAFLKHQTSLLGKGALLYLDPPYYVKGQRLYTNYYRHNDHKIISEFLRRTNSPWVVSYDNHTAIRSFYSDFRNSHYSLEYSARKYRSGSEVMFFSDDLSIPQSPPNCAYLFPSCPRLPQPNS